MTINVLKGKLLEEFCRMLLEGSGYVLCQEETEKIRYRKTDAIVEMRGRGTWHQIDLPFDFPFPVPFTNPIRVIGEVKYYKKPITKDTISQFIGVTRDICENYFAADDISNEMLCSRKLEQPLFVSATGFQKESQKLAYAHNIHLLSFYGNPLLKDFLTEINKFAEEVFHTDSNITDFEIRNAFQHYDHYMKNRERGLLLPFFFETSPDERIRTIYNSFFDHVKSYFIATTKTGQIMCFVSSQDFPYELLQRNSPVRVSIEYYRKKEKDPIDPYIGLSFQNGPTFFSTLPELLYEEFVKEDAKEGNAINIKEHHFSPLTIYKKDEEEKLQIFQVYFDKKLF